MDKNNKSLIEFVDSFFGDANWRTLSTNEEWHIKFLSILENARTVLRAQNLGSCSSFVGTLENQIASANASVDNDKLEFLNSLVRDVKTLEQFSFPELAFNEDYLEAEPSIAIPTMVSNPEKQFLRWLAKNCCCGQIVELGAWLGGVTYALAKGCHLSNHAGVKVHAFDAFVWHEWMNQAVKHNEMKADGDCFFDDFTANIIDVQDLVVPIKGAIGNRNLVFGSASEIIWNSQPIGLFVNDFWDDLDILGQSWDLFSPNFVHGETCVVFCQYGNVRAEQLRRFCLDKQVFLRPLYRIQGGALASFTFFNL